MNAYLKEIGDDCGITKILTTHTAKRTFASIMNERGVNITAIQLMLRQTKITATQHYITTNSQFHKDEMKKASQSLGDMFYDSLLSLMRVLNNRNFVVAVIYFIV